MVLFLEKGLLAYYESWSRPAGIIARTDDGTLIHHARTPDGEILTRIIRDGRVDFGGGLVLSEAFPAA